jgi:hypothetical protein
MGGAFREKTHESPGSRWGRGTDIIKLLYYQGVEKIITLIICFLGQNNVTY